VFEDVGFPVEKKGIKKKMLKIINVARELKEFIMIVELQREY